MRRGMKVLATAALSLGLLAGTANAQGPEPPLPLPAPKVTPIQVTGPPAQRLNLIILGDGYQWDQQSLFYADVDRNLSVMWATEPFRTYRNYMNVYAVEIASIDYGVRCDPDGRVRHADGTIRDTGVSARARDRRQEHRAADDLPERLRRPALPRHGLRQRAGQLHRQRRVAGEVLPGRHADQRDLRVRQRGAQPDPRHLRGSGAGDPAHVAEPADAGDLQHIHVRRHRRHARRPRPAARRRAR